MHLKYSAFSCFFVVVVVFWKVHLVACSADKARVCRHGNGLNAVIGAKDDLLGKTFKCVVCVHQVMIM